VAPLLGGPGARGPRFIEPPEPPFPSSLPLGAETWPRDATATRATLATDATTDWLQAGSPHLPLLVRSGATIPHRGTLARGRIWRTKASAIDVDERACGSLPPRVPRPSAIAPSQWPPRESGTRFRRPSRRYSHCPCSKLCCLLAVTTVKRPHTFAPRSRLLILLLTVRCPSSDFTPP